MTTPKTPLTATQLELLSDIDGRYPNLSEIWYGHSILTSTLFPASQPPKGTDFVSKSNGSVRYMLEAGVDDESLTREFPSGKYPRLIMAWIAKKIRAAGKNRTEYVDPETRIITIPSINMLCEEMGVGHGGKTAETVSKQLRRLLACRISIRMQSNYKGKRHRVMDTAYIPLVEAMSTVSDDMDEGSSAAMFRLTEEVYKRLGKESAPFDTRIAAYLLSSRSVMPYDVYLWLNGSMRNLRHPLPVDWDWLHKQFGEEIDDLKVFKRQFRAALEKIRTVYPQLHVDVPSRGKGIIVYPSAMMIDPRKASQDEN